MSGPNGHLETLRYDETACKAYLSPIDERQRCLVSIACVVKRDKLDTSVLATPVEVRDLQVDLERLRNGG